MGNQKDIRVLIAEDDYMVGKSTAALLRKMGYTVVGQALNGREAIEMTQSLRPDVILMDIKMPIMDGIEATKQIYETCPTPVVALTAYATPEMIEQAIAAGMGAYLTKPASVQEIERAINVTIARFDDTVELRRLNTELQAEITERKRAEELLRESEERLKILFEFAPDGYYVNDLKGNFIDGNKAAEEITGHKREDLIGKNFLKLKLLPLSQIPKAAALLAQNALGKPTGPDEFTLNRSDGSQVPVEILTYPVKIEGQTVVLGIARDITERKRAQEEIRTLNQFLDSVIDNANVWLNVLDEKANVVIWNRAAEEISGYSREEVVGHGKIWEWLYPDEKYRHEIVARAITIIETGGEERDTETTIQRKDGQTRIISWNSQNLADEKGNPIGSIALGRDITERKQAEEALRESEEKYRTILENIEDSYFEVDIAGNFTFFNDSLCRLLGYPEDELMGMNNRQYMDAENAKKVYQTFNAVYRTGEPYRAFDWEVIRKDGTTRFVEASVSLIRDPAGEPAGFRGIVRDVTERKQAEEEIKRRNRELAALNAITAAMMQSALDLDEVLQRTVDGIVQGLGCNTAFIFLLDEEKEVFRGGAVSTKAKMLERINALLGFPLLQLKIPARSDFNETVSNLLAGQTTIKHDLHELVRPLLSRRVASTMQRLLDSRTFFTMPLLAKGKTVGGIVASTPEKLSEADAEKLMTFANQAAIAIENARLYQETQQRALEQETLREAALALTTALDRNKVIERILAQLQQVVPYDSASVQLLRGDQMELVGGRGFSNLPDLLGTSFPADGDNPNSEVIRIRAPFIVEDVPAAYEGFRKDPHRKISIRSWLGVPMLVGEQLVGMIALDKREPEFYTQQHARLAEAFAAQAAVAIENARLFTETEQRTAELSTMLEAARAVSSTLDLEQVLALIAEEMAKAIGAAGCTLSRWDREADAVVVLTEWHQRRAEWDDEPGTSYALDDYPATRAVLEKRQPITIQATDPDAEPTEVALMQQAGVVSLLMLPLAVGERVIGLVELDETERERVFTDAEIRLCQALADQVAVAIENARLYEEEKRRATQLALINEVGEKAASILDSDRLMQEVTHSIQESFDYYNVALLLLDEERGEVVTQAVAGGFEHIVAGQYRQSLDEGIIGFVARTGKPWLANDVSKDPYYIKGFLGEVLNKSELCVPIRLDDKVIGALDLQSIHLNAFDQSDVVVMEAVADRVAIGIQNARLYEETQQKSERLAQTLTISELLHRDLNLDQLLEQIAQGTVELGFRQAVINVCPPGQDVVRVRAVAGLEGPDREALMGATYHWSEFQAVMQDRFQVSRSYLIPHEEVDWERDFQGVLVVPRREDRGPGYWHPEVMLLVPLWGSRGEPVGLLSVDEPVDGLLPDLNTIQTLEAFANQAAIAIENARLFKEIEQRRVYLEGVLGAAPDAIVTLDTQHLVAEWNSGAERLFGYSREEAIGKDIDHLITRPNILDEAVEFTRVVMSGLQVRPVETVRYRKDGSPVDVLVAGSPILVGGEPIGTVAVYTDITARKRIEDTLRALALLDELTGLYNRRGFSTLGQQQLKAAQRVQNSMLLLFADFDGLKKINDAFGHAEGDQALIEVANILQETFRESDIIARIGGDEFVVLAIETDSVGAEVLAIRLQEHLETRNARESSPYRLSLSVGIAHYDPENPCSIDELLTRADRAMYEKKRGDTPG